MGQWVEVDRIGQTATIVSCTNHLIKLQYLKHGEGRSEDINSIWLAYDGFKSAQASRVKFAVCFILNFLLNRPNKSSRNTCHRG